MRVVLTGIYNAGEIRTGSEEVAVSVFREMQMYTETFFVTKYSMIKPHSFLEKLFGLKQEGNLYYVGFLRMPFVIKQLNPDILHGINYDPFVGLLFWWFSGTKIKLHFTLHGVITYENSRKPYLSYWFRLTRSVTEKLIFRYSESFAFYTRRILKLAQKYYQFRNNLLSFTVNGFSAFFSEKFPEKPESGKTIKLVTHAGLMDRVRGIEVLFDTLIGADIHFELVIIGEREHLITPKELKGKVTFTEKLPPAEYIDLLNSCDVYICLSLLESFSISTAEAMAMGCAVIVSENTGISEYLVTGVNGFVVSVENPSQIRELLEDLYKNRKLIRETGREAVKVREVFTWEKAVKGYIKDYERLLNGK